MITSQVKDGICTGRNGTFPISATHVSGYNNNVRIDCVSKTKKTILNAGITIDRNAAKDLANSIYLYLKQS